MSTLFKSIDKIDSTGTPQVLVEYFEPDVFEKKYIYNFASEFERDYSKTTKEG